MESSTAFLESNTVFLTPDDFQALKLAIFDENLDKKIQYSAAILLAVRIYEYNLTKNSPDFQEEPKKCKSPTCIDKLEIYKIDTLEIKTDILDSIPEEHKAPIDEIRLILNRAVNQEEHLLYRFLAASAMSYIRETPSKDIINILTKTFINPSSILNLGSEEDLENNNLIKQLALDSLQLFSEYNENAKNDTKKLTTSIDDQITSIDNQINGLMDERGLRPLREKYLGLFKHIIEGGGEWVYDQIRKIWVCRGVCKDD